MREILFKAKRKDNGEWVEGYPVRYGFAGKEKWYIVPSYASDLYAFEIIPETICQYTGLTNEDGKKIFEGDIFKYHYLGDKRTYKVIYHEKYNTFVRCSGRGFDFLYHPKNIEVIGNIFDNPEIVEGGVK